MENIANQNNNRKSQAAFNPLQDEYMNQQGIPSAQSRDSVISNPYITDG